jgi:hypothetical protein
MTGALFITRAILMTKAILDKGHSSRAARGNDQPFLSRATRGMTGRN